MPAPSSRLRDTLALWRQGLSWTRIGERVGMTAAEVGDIITSQVIADVAALEVQYGAELLTDDPDGCRMAGCTKPRQARGFCVAHISRVRRGYGLFGDVDPTVRTCSVCGARWCGMKAASRNRRTCGDRDCLTAAIGAASKNRPSDPVVAARVKHVIELLKTGMQHGDIAEATGLSKPRVSQIAIRNGLRRYRPRTQADTSRRSRPAGA